jgi:hypothetical protein
VTVSTILLDQNLDAESFHSKCRSVPRFCPNYVQSFFALNLIGEEWRVSMAEAMQELMGLDRCPATGVRPERLNEDFSQ